MIKKWLAAVWRFLALRESLATSSRILIPITIVIFLLYLAINMVDEKGEVIMHLFFSNTFPLAGLALVIIIFIILGRWLVEEERRGKYILYFLLQKIPLCGKYIKPKEKSKPSWQRCFFWETPTVRTPAWITGEQTVEGDSDPPCVYVAGPNMPPGKAVLVDRKLVIRVGLSTDELLQIYMTLGFNHPEQLKIIPWENETWGEAMMRYKKCPWH